MRPLVLFNKPYGVLCQFSPQGDRATLRDFLPQRDIYPAGRLDADSEGLVLLTAEGAVQHRITDPRHKLPKTYCVQVEGTIGAAALDVLRRGVRLSDFTTRPAIVQLIEEPAWLWSRTPPIRARRHIPTSWIELIVTEGRNRQVRHMTAAAGHPALRLIRRAIGEWDISGLAPGEWREVPLTERTPPDGKAAPAARKSTTRRRSR